MTERVSISEVSPSAGEEIANSLSHGVGLALAIAATPILIVGAARAGSAWNIVGVSVFAASMLTLYFASTLYHALTRDGAKRIFRVLDHGAIFLLIAGELKRQVIARAEGGEDLPVRALLAQDRVPVRILWAPSFED